MGLVYLCDAVRTPIGRYGGSLATVRTDDLAAIPIASLLSRNPTLPHEAIGDVVFGCANQAGEDNRNVARMAGLLAGIPVSVPGVTVNRLCGSGMEAVAHAARTILSGECEIAIAGGVESMSRAPFVMPKAQEAFARSAEIHDTTIGWRFINPRMQQLHGTDALALTAEHVAAQHNISRADQDRFALWSQEKAAHAQSNGALAREITAVSIPAAKGEVRGVDVDEHPRATSLERLATLRPIVRADGTVTAGNASGINDGAAALLLASESAAARYGLSPRAKVLGCAVAGVEPRIMGMGPVPATRALLARLRLTLNDFDILEFNEAFAAQALACTRALGLSDNDPRINPLGGAIALGHPLGMSGARLVGTSLHQLQHSGSARALCTMCVGVGQGISLALERV